MPKLPDECKAGNAHNPADESRPGMPPQLALRSEWSGEKQCKVTAEVDGKVVHVDTFNPSAANTRARFASAVAGKCQAVTPEAVEEELLKIATTRRDGRLMAAEAPQPTEATEIEARRVVRPELFHTDAVSGITVSVVHDIGGKLVSRWRAYLRWADGRREVIELPDRVTLPDGAILYVHPNPGDPPEMVTPGWSSKAREDWLAGAAAPDPAAVFRRLCAQIARYVDFPPETAAGTVATIALWAMHTYLYPAWDAIPYLYVGGTMGSGKSRVLDVVQRLAFRPFATANLTAPTLFRSLHAYGGTMLYDEAEQLRNGSPEAQEVLSVFLSGYKRGGAATRLEPVGDGFHPVRFGVFGPKALACIAGLPPTLASRAIPVTMFRSPAGSEKPARRLDADPAGWQSLRDDLHAVALEHGPTWVALADRAGVVPAGVTGRNYELWQPLLALAEWLERCGAERLLGVVQGHATATVASAKEDTIPEADEVLLDVLAEAVRSGQQPTPGELLEAARQRDGVTFKPLTPAWVSRRLKAYGIPPATKANGERKFRGVTSDLLRRIEQHYGIDLGMSRPAA